MNHPSPRTPRIEPVPFPKVAWPYRFRLQEREEVKKSVSSTMPIFELHAAAQPFGTESLLTRALRSFAGSAVCPIRHDKDLTYLDNDAPAAVFSMSPSTKLKMAIRKKGYSQQHAFLAVPSRRVPRWLIPTQNRCAILAATQIYEPHKWVMRLLKQSLIGMTRIGWTGWGCPKLLVATKDMTALEQLVEAVTSEPAPLFALSIGRQAAVRKLTIQVMRPTGEILGYMKLPLTKAATERVRNEARVLQRLWDFPSLRPHIPRLLYAGDCNGTYVLFQRSLQGTRGPTTFTEMHRSFLEKMRATHTVRVPARNLIEAVATKWEAVAPVLGTEWEHLGQEVLRRANRELEGRPLRCGVIHGDFAPWNTRVCERRMLLFDWESSSWEAPTSWDTFHFHVQTLYFRGRNGAFKMPKRDMNDEISFMLYLLNAVVQYLAEENQLAVSLCKTLLIRAFQGKQAWMTDSAVAA